MYGGWLCYCCELNRTYSPICSNLQRFLSKSIESNPPTFACLSTKILTNALCLCLMQQHFFFPPPSPSPFFAQIEIRVFCAVWFVSRGHSVKRGGGMERSHSTTWESGEENRNKLVKAASTSKLLAKVVKNAEKLVICISYISLKQPLLS